MAALLLVTGAASAQGAASSDPDEQLGPEQVEFLESRYREAQRLYRAGHYRGAFRLADAILVVAPGVPFRGELRELRRLAEGRHLGTSVLEVRFEAAPAEGFPRRRLGGALVLENLTRQPIEVGRPGRRESLGSARVRVIEYYADGSLWSYEHTHPVHLEEGFILEPGQARRVPLSFELADEERSPVAQRLSVRGSFRPSDLRTPDERVDRTIPWVDHETLLVEPSLADPEVPLLRQVKLALLSRDAPRLVAATLLLLEEERHAERWRRQRRAVAELFVNALEEEGSAMNRLLFRLLELVTGVRLEPRAETWKLWLGTWKDDEER